LLKLPCDLIGSTAARLDLERVSVNHGETHPGLRLEAAGGTPPVLLPQPNIRLIIRRCKAVSSGATAQGAG
jgi:hypothetical protein